ncbi:MAG: LIM domain-containing protein [Candidatus Eremiobacterota bacterium]
MLFYFIFLLFITGEAFSRNLEVSDLVCSNCGCTIHGQCWTMDGKVYCNKCYERLVPVCAKCGKPCVNGYYTIERYVYCKDCFYKYARCDICGSLLEGNFVRNKAGKKFCQTCIDRYTACSDCACPVGPDGYNLGYSRWLCPDCASVAIFTHDQLAYVYVEAVAQLKAMGIVITRTVDNLTIMDQKNLEMSYYKTKNKEYVPSGGVGGFYSFSSNETGSASRIFVLDGLSYERALAVLSHELTHAWQIDNCPRDQRLVYREGFAQWLAYKVMLHKGYTDEAEALLASQDAIYGEGLKFMISVEAYYGVNGTIEYVKTLR